MNYELVSKVEGRPGRLIALFSERSPVARLFPLDMENQSFRSGVAGQGTTFGGECLEWVELGWPEWSEKFSALYTKNRDWFYVPQRLYKQTIHGARRDACLVGFPGG